MKLIRAFSRLLVVSALIGPLLCFAGGPRSETDLNADWSFHYGETPGAEAPGFSATGWEHISVPHTWNAADGQDGIKSGDTSLNGMLHGDYARGTAWYRRFIKPDAAWKGKQVYLQFDGVNRLAEVFLNGKSVGQHLGGHARFRFDVTALLDPSHDNVLAVKVNNEDQGVIPQSGDFTFFGGIYRGVSLVLTNPIQIETLDYASSGAFFAQEKVTAENAQLSARIELANHETAPSEVEVRVVLLDEKKHAVVEVKKIVKVAPAERATAVLPVTVRNPHLWSGRADPYLYTARVEVRVGGKVRDSLDQQIGLRSYSVDPAKGFFLNGKYVDLHGASRHQDRIDKGWAISAADEREDMALMAEMGCTANRVAHYQQSQLWYDLADQVGIVQWAEIPFVDEALPTEKFTANAEQQMRELIRQNYNHPAICFWGCGNENSDAGISFVAGIAQYGPISEKLIQTLNQLAHAEDATRLTTYASFHSEADVHFALPGQPPVNLKGEPQRWYTDVTAFNKYYGWYYGEPEDTGKFFDSLHERNPTQRLALSEYGAGGAISQHEVLAENRSHIGMEEMRKAAFSRFHSEEYQAYYHEKAWAALQARPYVWGKFVWNMFDFASDGRNEGDHAGRNDKGLVTFDRKTRKDAFYFYKANWSNEPVLYLTSRRFTERKDANAPVKVYSNAPEVELFVGDHSMGKKTSSDHVFQWPAVTLVSGDNRIRVSATVNGKAMQDECVWTLKSAQ